MNASPMIREVDKIVANLLIAEGAVCIPGAGSLRIVRYGARRISSRKIVPPCRMVEFTSQPVGTSLAAAVARAAGCDEGRAAEICGRWLAQVRTEEALTIGGVGILREKSFTMDAAFDKLLNPQGHEPLKLRGARGHWLLWTVAAFAIFCGLGACGWILYDRLNSSAGLDEISGVSSERRTGSGAPGFAPADGASADNRPAAVSASGGADRSSAAVDAGTEKRARSGAAMKSGGAAASAASAGAGADRSLLAGNVGADAAGAVRASESFAGATPSGKSAHSDRHAAGAPGPGAGASSAGVPAAGRPSTDRSSSEAVSSDPMQAARLVSGHTYVVQGVYSSLETARRALRELERREPALHGRIYLYGPKYMVSMFSSETSEQSIAFVRAYADRYPDLWTYRAK